MLSQTLYHHQAQSMQPSSASGANTQGEQHLRAQLELLKSHDIPSLSSPSSNHARDPRNPPPIQPAPSRPSNGYEGLTPATQETAQAAIAKASADAHIHPDLRAHPHHAQAANMMPIAPPTGHEPGATAGPAAPLAPAPSAPMPMDDQNDGRKAKRELSQSKRAAQNRAAQRAFRQRKEGYIKKLEQQVRDYADMESSFKILEAENRALRDYVVQCQSRLVEVTGEYPPPPPNVNLSQPPAPQGPPMNAPEPPPSNAAVGTPLEAVAQAVAGLAAHEQMTEQRQSYPSPTFKAETFKSEQVSDDTRSAEEINRHLQDDGAPTTNI